MQRRKLLSFLSVQIFSSVFTFQFSSKRKSVQIFSSVPICVFDENWNGITDEKIFTDTNVEGFALRIKDYRGITKVSSCRGQRDYTVFEINPSFIFISVITFCEKKYYFLFFLSKILFSCPGISTKIQSTRL